MGQHLLNECNCKLPILGNKNSVRLRATNVAIVSVQSEHTLSYQLNQEPPQDGGSCLRTERTNAPLTLSSSNGEAKIATRSCAGDQDADVVK